MANDGAQGTSTSDIAAWLAAAAAWIAALLNTLCCTACLLPVRPKTLSENNFYFLKILIFSNCFHHFSEKKCFC
jgi:hypothetical protein